jgi:hypothetical protein
MVKIENTIYFHIHTISTDFDLTVKGHSLYII